MRLVGLPPWLGSRKQVRVYGYSSTGPRSGFSGRITTRPGVLEAPPNINANSGLQGPGYLSHTGIMNSPARPTPIPRFAKNRDNTEGRCRARARGGVLRERAHSYLIAAATVAHKLRALDVNSQMAPHT